MLRIAIAEIIDLRLARAHARRSIELGNFAALAKNGELIFEFVDEIERLFAYFREIEKTVRDHDFKKGGHGPTGEADEGERRRRSWLAPRTEIDNGTRMKEGASIHGDVRWLEAGVQEDILPFQKTTVAARWQDGSVP